MEIIKLQLASKNNKQNGFYLYIPIVKKDNLYFWCDSIKTAQSLKAEHLQVGSLTITREIPPQFYQANGIKI